MISSTYKSLIFLILLSTFIMSCKGTVNDLAEETTEIFAKNNFSKSVVKGNRTSKKLAIIGLPDPKRSYSRKAIDRAFILIKSTLHSEGLERGLKENKSYALFTDGYTGKTLTGGSKYEFDHIRPAQDIHKKYKSLLNDDQLAQVINCRANITTTNTQINRAKGKWPLERLLRDTEKTDQLGINRRLAKRLLEKADIEIKRKVQEILSNRESL